LDGAGLARALRVSSAPKSGPWWNSRLGVILGRMSIDPARAEFRGRVEATVAAIQQRICSELETLERDAGGTAEFREDRWEREGGGGGTSRVLQGGSLFEKGGVNVSAVHGALSEQFAKELPGSGTDFYASGVSLVIHPRNPWVPTVHANFRYIEHGERRWFGGGADLTPYYHFVEDEEHFHSVWRSYCAAHRGIGDYPKFRDWCDRYFYLPHRGERRGVGGIFFDDLRVDDTIAGHADRLLSFIADGGQRVLDAYVPIVQRRMLTSWDDVQRSWQKLRRGRYVEFNLLYDRGTTFGLRTGGRTESILMSLPPDVRWSYGEEPEPDTPEAALLERLRLPPPPA
jgi:coproporphyrinogen III oxidase